MVLYPSVCFCIIRPKYLLLHVIPYVYQNQNNELSDKALENLTAIEDEIEQSSNYFKPNPDKIYMFSINPEEKFVPRLNEKFKDPQGRPTIRFEVKITHINSGKEQLWEVSKTVSIQLIGVLKKGFRVIQLQRFGEDRGTVYKIEGVQ